MKLQVWPLKWNRYFPVVKCSVIFKISLRFGSLDKTLVWIIGFATVESPLVRTFFCHHTKKVIKCQGKQRKGINLMSLKPNLLWWWRWNDRTQNMLVKEHKLCVPLTLLSTIILSSTAVCLDQPVVWIIYCKKKEKQNLNSNSTVMNWFSKNWSLTRACKKNYSRAFLFYNPVTYKSSFIKLYITTLFWKHMNNVN